VPSILEHQSQTPVGTSNAGVSATGSGVRAQAVSTTVPPTVSNFPTGVQKVDAQTGTVYVVSVSGPKMYSHQKQSFMQRVAEDTQLYQVIHIDGGKLRFEARTAVGQLYDAFELHKRPGKINDLIELDPEVPQNLREGILDR
jgi:acid phosphatase type 7